MDTTRTGYGEKDTGAAGEKSVRGGSITGRLFIVKGNESNAESNSAVGQRGYGDAHNAEHAFDAEAGEGFGNEEVAIDKGLVIVVGVNGH